MVCNPFYIYVYMDPGKKGKFTYGTLPFSFLYYPFYIGKGQGKRWKAHLCKPELYRNSRKTTKIKSILAKGMAPLVVKLYEGLEEKEAFALEADLIRSIGRIPKGTLLNCTDGGEGPSGRIMPEEAREKIRQANLGHKAWNRGKHLSDVHKKNVSTGRKGKGKGAKRPREQIEKQKEFYKQNGHPRTGAVISKETRQKISAKLKNRKWTEGQYQKRISYLDRIGKSPLSGVPRIKEIKEKISNSLKKRHQIRLLLHILSLYKEKLINDSST